jgi:hypothetical protein
LKWAAELASRMLLKMLVVISVPKWCLVKVTKYLMQLLVAENVSPYCYLLKSLILYLTHCCYL